MRIIDKQKDFYDHLVGQYGMDPLRIYVRNSPNPNGSEVRMFRDVYKYFTSDEELREDKTKRWYYFAHESVFFNRYYGIIVRFDIVIGFHRFRFEVNRYKDKETGKIVRDVQHNEVGYKDGPMAEAPIYIDFPGEYNVIGHYIHHIDNPLIKDLGLAQYFKAEDVWQWIEEYLGTLKNVEPNPVADKDKIVAHGFDLKTSFRNVK